MAWPSSFPSGTAGYMKDRIADELARDDLTTQIAAAIDDSIKIYQKEVLRFTETFSTQFRTRQGRQNYTVLSDDSFPSVASVRNLYKVDWALAQISRTQNELSRYDDVDILMLTQDGTQSGPPDSYAISNETIMLYPIPDQGLGELGAVSELTLTAPGGGYAPGVYTVNLTGGTGTNATAQVTVVAGSVTSVTLIDGGQDYIVGDVLSATATSLGVAVLDPVDGLISAFSLLSAGSGFLAGSYQRSLTGGSGTGATANIVVSAVDGSVSSVQLLSPGQNYVAGDLLSASIPATSTEDGGGQIGSFDILFGSSGITNGSYTNQAITGGTGLGATGNFTVAGGQVTVASVFNPGVGYVLGDIVSVALPGGATGISSGHIQQGGTGYDGIGSTVALTGGSGSGATATLEPRGGTITLATIVNPGNGYLAGDILTATGGGLGAGSGFEFLVDTAGVALQVSSLTNSGIPGVINGLTTLNGGSGYTNGTYLAVALTGGTGLGATANIQVQGGAITGVAIVNPGVGYGVGNVLSAGGLGAGTGFNVTVSATTTTPVTQSPTGAFQIQVNETSSGPTSAAIVGSGFTATVAAVVTELTGYVITLGGTVTYGAPASDTVTGNRWMTHAERLIRSRAKYIIATNVTRNQMMAQAMSPLVPGGEAYEALRELVVEVGRIRSKGYVKAMPFVLAAVIVLPVLLWT